ncbi:phosphatidylinositol-glycan biosynthesis class S protein [Kalaharituber pfeilii]|nr:phosphatidylinositol-glycan biosynthesis class S protein [Kalaharituber pfeilii]
MADEKPRPGASAARSKASTSEVETKKVYSLEPTRQELRIRGYILFSFWAVVIFLGVPLWYVTTSIYRAPLPLGQMTAWSEGKECKIEFPLLVDVIAPEISGEKGGAGDTQDMEVADLIRNVQLHLDDAREGKTGGGHLRLKLANLTKSEQCLDRSRELGRSNRVDSDEDMDEGENVAAILRLLPGQPGSTAHIHSLEPSSRTIKLFYASTHNPASSASLASLSSYTAKMLQEVFREEEQMITYFLEKAATSTSEGNGSREGTQPQAGDVDMSRKIARMLKYSPTYHITFSLFTGSGVPSSWDIVPAIENYFAPLLSALSPISNFTVDSQVQFYASFSPTIKPVFDDNLHAWTLTKDDLSNFINSAEWPLTSIKSYPTINFIIYIPDHSFSPLVIPESSVRSNSWLLPQWGGVSIINPKMEVMDNKTVVNSPPAHLSLDDLKPSLDIFATQVLALLGTPSAASSASSSLPIRIDSLIRQRTAETLLSASSTLGSLARLVLALPSIAIPQTVSTSVDKTLGALEKSCAQLRSGRFIAALREGREAATEAEKAFFERTMVAQVYFPDEHKVAVYLPLLGPVGVPLLMSGVKALKGIMAARRKGTL